MKGILFDNDGTLVDTHDIILASMRYSTQAVLGKVIPDEVLMRKVGQPLAVQMRDFTPDEQLQPLRIRRGVLICCRKQEKERPDPFLREAQVMSGGC